ncbi:class I SAM-dependent methyltransferase [Thiohalorhabdus sp. Cl-TMA]|uniref:Class I SAM-dependent methyltransferase n=1 Tax=Thiohalorhabdus methylotrophus TaxID=3242694 RepID=A0ABV4TUH0_9GAMM
MGEEHTETRRTDSVGADWDHSSDPRFVDYYARQSLTEENRERLERIRDDVLWAFPRQARGGPLEVVDIGCGPGAQSQMWADSGHSVHGLDVNEELVDLARKRAESEGQDIEFVVGSATELPWESGSMDVCLVPELLEHVPFWRACLDEFARILRPGGVLFLSTNNRLCPVQEEFNLPFYSWYPRPLQRHFENLAQTTRPDLANYATYPAVNWFTFYGLRRDLRERGFRSYDRFDTSDASQKGTAGRMALTAIDRVPPVRFLAHALTPYTRIVAVKEGHRRDTGG